MLFKTHEDSFSRIVSNVNLKALTEKWILDAWLGPGYASADWYITALKIQTKICKGGRQVKMESFKSTSTTIKTTTIKTTIKSICPLPFSRIFLRNIFCKFLSKYLWQSLYLVKSHAFTIFFRKPRRMRFYYENCSLRNILFYALRWLAWLI